MNWLFKSEKLPAEQRRAVMRGEAPRDFSVVESSRRRWRIKKADRLIIISGAGEELAFVAHGVVENVKQWIETPEYEARSTEEEPVRVVQIELRVSNIEPFEEDRTLANLMFSLKKVYNFGQPWRHFRHRGGILDEDFTTIIEGRVAWDRSVFYGLLRHLPTEWRTAFELQAQIDSLTSTMESGLFEGEPRPIPGIPHLFDLLERSAVTPLILSSEVSILASAALPDEQRLDFVMGPGEPLQQVEIDLNSLFWLAQRVAQSPSQSAEARLRRLREDDTTNLQRSSLEDREEQWLPHHW